MSDLSLFGITAIFFCVISVIEGLTETGTLLLVPAGGAYDPNALWDADISTLVGVNDCVDDEGLDITNLALKGTFRSERVLNLTHYEDVKLSYYVYDDYGNEILSVTDCPMGAVTICTQGGNELITGDFATGDGFKLYTNNTLKTKVAVFNPRNYLTTAPNGVKIVISKEPDLQNFNDPGYMGCYTKPTSGVTSFSPVTVDGCFSECTASTYFFLSSTECFCVADLAGLAKIYETECSDLCPGDNQQICGSSSAASAYKSSSFSEFKAFYDGLSGKQELENKTITEANSGTGQVDFGTATFVSAAKVVIEEECQLTNLYFEEPPTSFEVLVGDCSATNSNYHATLDGSGDPEAFPAVQTTCVKLEAKESNYTYPRALITLYGPTGNTIDVGGVFVIKGTWTIPDDSSSILSSTMESSSSMDTSSFMMQLSPTTEPAIMPSTAMGMTATTMDISFTNENGGTTIDPSTTEPTIGATDATSSSGASASPSADATSSPGASASASASGSAPMTVSPSHSPSTLPSPSPSSPASASASASASAIAPTTPGTGPATTTKKPIYTKDGRLIIEACTCVCKPPPLKDNQTPLEQAQEKAKILSDELHVDTKNLSATIRKKESAADERPSASAGGYVACVLLGIVGVLFIAADVLSISAHIHMLKSNVSSMFDKS